MSDILDAFVEDLFDPAFAVDGLYQSQTEGDVDVQVILREGVLVEDDGGGFVRRTTARIPSSQVPRPRSTDRLIAKGKTWSVERLESDDGHTKLLILGGRL